MTREDWFRTPDFVILRLLNNLAAELNHKTQPFQDVLNLIAAIEPDIEVSDRFSLVERQLKIVSLETSNLWAYVRKLEEFLGHPEFTDMMFTPATTDSPDTTQQTQQDQHQDLSSAPTPDS